MSDASAILIDANQYLTLYGTVSGKRLLAPLRELREYIFISRQTVDEVNRNKLDYAAKFLDRQFEKLCLNRMGIPDHLFGVDDETLRTIRGRVESLTDEVKTIKEELDDLAVRTLKSISRSEDEVSVALNDIFSLAKHPSCEELNRACNRKALGNPPGKANDPIGDQLTWEQFLTHGMGRTRLWIVTADGDYITKYGKHIFLNPALMEDLRNACRMLPEVRCFDNLLTGLQDFIKVTGITSKTMPTGAEAAAIEEDLIANHYCGSLWVTRVHGAEHESHPLSYQGGKWCSPKMNFIIKRDRVIVDGQSYPVCSTKPFLASFVHNGQQMTLTE